ncbi:MAG: hypothetical protein ABI277_10835 [Burkholderiaceae bacterium]
MHPRDFSDIRNEKIQQAAANAHAYVLAAQKIIDSVDTLKLRTTPELIISLAGVIAIAHGNEIEP